MTKKSIVTIILGGALFLIIGIGSAYADTVVLEATKDTFTNEAYPDRNYGDISAVVISNAPISRLGFVDFRTWDPPAGVVVDSVTFNFYIYDHTFSEDAWLRVCAAVTVSDWDENEIKWSGPYPGAYSVAGSYSEERIDLSTGWKSMDVTNIAQLWLSGEVENRGLAIRYTEADDFTASFRSREYGSNAPYLEVVYHSEIMDVEFVPPFELVSPHSEVINISRPTFSWTSLEGFDASDLVLVVNRTTDGGADIEEVIRSSVPIDVTEYITTTELEDGEHRWYMEAVWGGVPVYRTESNEFSIELPEEEAAAVPAESIDPDTNQTEETVATAGSDEETDSGEAISLGTEKEEGVDLDSLTIILIIVVGAAGLVLSGMFIISTRKKDIDTGLHSEELAIDGEQIQTDEMPPDQQ